MKTPKEIGELLKNARQKKNLTIEKVAIANRIQFHIIEALENGTADNNLSQVYVLLFLKKYALFLHLDADSVVADYKASYMGEEKQVFDVKTKSSDIKIEAEKWIDRKSVVQGKSVDLGGRRIIKKKKKQKKNNEIKIYKREKK